MHARCWVLKDRAASRSGAGDLQDSYAGEQQLECGEYRPSFENYTVDASILELRLRSQIYKMI